MRPMEFECFKEYVLEELREHVKLIESKTEIRVNESIRNGHKRTGIILPSEGTALQALRIVYLEDVYQDYVNGTSKEDIVDHMVGILCNSAKTELVKEVLLRLSEKDEVLSRVIPSVVNYEGNKSFLEDKIYRRFEDLAIIYRIPIKIDKQSCMTVTVTDNLCKRLEVTEEDIVGRAMENVVQQFGVSIRSINAILAGTLAQGKEKFGECMESHCFYCITNKRGVFGAVYLTNVEILDVLAEQLQANLLICPSSIHEILAISENVADAENLRRIVSEVNESIAPEEWLGNNVYRYDRTTKTVSLA